jgi:outer membrane beta-barrel protein
MLLIAAAALAQDTVDIGVLKNSELRVVQKQLYKKEGKLELGVGLAAVMDGFTIAPALHLGGAYHLSENIGVELSLGGGYGLKSGFTTLLESPAYGVAVEANRYLAHAEVDLQWTPIYAKANFGGKKILHYDIFAKVGIGGMLQQSILPAAEITFAPEVPIGLGARFFVNPTTFVRFEVEDRLALESFPQEGGVGLIQKPTVALGLSILTGGKK